MEISEIILDLKLDQLAVAAAIISCVPNITIVDPPSHADKINSSYSEN